MFYYFYALLLVLYIGITYYLGSFLLNLLPPRDVARALLFVLISYSNYHHAPAMSVKPFGRDMMMIITT